MENIDYKSLHLTPEQEDQNIEAAFQDVLNGYLHSNHRKKVEIIKRAYSFAKEAHKGIRRRSGEPYILHPIAVAKIVSQEIGLGSTSICSALLHDVVEDTDMTLEELEKLFPPAVTEGVRLMTHDDSTDYFDYVRRIKGTVAEPVKRADIAHNSDLSRMDTVTEKDLLRIEKYKKALRILDGEE